MPECSYSGCCEGVYRHHRGRAFCEDHYRRVLAEWLSQLVDELQDVPWQEIPDVATPTAAKFTSLLDDSVDELERGEPIERGEA